MALCLWLLSQGSSETSHATSLPLGVLNISINVRDPHGSPEGKLLSEEPSQILYAET